MERSISRHVENATNDILTYVDIPSPSDVKLIRESIEPQIRSAVDDATAFFRGDSGIHVDKAIAFHNGLVAAFDKGGNQIPEIQRFSLVELMNLMLEMKSRIQQFSELTPLIDAYGLESKAYGIAIQSLGYDEKHGLMKMRDETKAKIDSILKGTK